MQAGRREEGQIDKSIKKGSPERLP